MLLSLKNTYYIIAATLFKDLWAVRSADRTCDSHDDYVMFKVQNINSTIIKNLNLLSYSIGWKIIKVYVQPILLYASVAWNTANHRKVTVLGQIHRYYSKRLKGVTKYDYSAFTLFEHSYCLLWESTMTSFPFEVILNP